MPVESVREAHYKIKDTTGIDIESICAEYEEDEIDEETVGILKSMGFQFENSSGMGDGIVNVPEMVRLWIFLLQKADPTLELKIVDDDIPRLHIDGKFKKLGRAKSPKELEERFDVDKRMGV